MTEQQIFKFGEIQYLTGRLDELYYKALPNVIDLHGNRRLDARVQKYLDKLKAVDETAYYLYLVEHQNRVHAKERSQRVVKNILTDVLEFIQDPEMRAKIETHLEKYKHI